MRTLARSNERSWLFVTDGGHLENSGIEALIELTYYRRDNPVFPHDPTLDQFYDPRRFDSYRSLGHHIGCALHDALMNDEDMGRDVAEVIAAHAPHALGNWLACLYERTEFQKQPGSKQVVDRDEKPLDEKPSVGHVPPSETMPDAR